MPKPPNIDLNTPYGRAQAEARKRILAGERIGGHILKATHGVNSNVASVVARQLSREGYRLVREQERAPQGGIYSFYRLAGDDEEAFDPNARLRASRKVTAAEAEARRNADAERKRKARAVEREAKQKKAEVEVANGRPLVPPPRTFEMPTLPGLGQPLSVRWLMLDDDSGEVMIGLANGAHVWNVAVRGVAER
jgi:hypothetical protein